MIETKAAQDNAPRQDTIVLLRRLASVVRGVSDFTRFVGSLRPFFEHVALTSGRDIKFDLLTGPGEKPAAPFGTPELSAPVAIGDRVRGMVRVAPPAAERPFGPEDLRLVGTLAELTGSLLEVAQKSRQSQTTADALRRVYDQLPLGVICFGPSGGPILVNARANVMMGDMMWASRDQALAFLEQRCAPGDNTPGLARACFTAQSGTVLAEIRELPGESGPPITMIALIALDSQDRNLRVMLEREIYRSRWLRQPLALVVLEAAGDAGRMFSSLPGIRLALRAGDGCEVLGARQIGLVLPGRERVQALQTARLVARALGEPALRSACQVIGEGNERADILIKETLAALEPADALIQPRLLVVDRYRAVPETVELIMRDHFAVEMAASSEEGLARLREVPVDAILVEHDPEAGFSGVDFLQAARVVQPEVAGLLTTTRIDFSTKDAGLPENARFVRKPFSVVSLRQTLDALLPAPTPPS